MNCPICECHHDKKEVERDFYTLPNSSENSFSMIFTQYSNIIYSCWNCKIKWKIVVEHIEDDEE